MPGRAAGQGQNNDDGISLWAGGQDGGHDAARPSETGSYSHSTFSLSGVPLNPLTETYHFSQRGNRFQKPTGFCPRTFKGAACGHVRGHPQPCPAGFSAGLDVPGNAGLPPHFYAIQNNDRQFTGDKDGTQGAR